jgi:hypothetical protein
MGEEEVQDNPFRTYVIVEHLQGGLYSDLPYEEFDALMAQDGLWVEFDCVAQERKLVRNKIRRHLIIGFADIKDQQPPDEQQAQQAQPISLEDFQRMTAGDTPVAG